MLSDLYTSSYENWEGFLGVNVNHEAVQDLTSNVCNGSPRRIETGTASHDLLLA